MGDVLGIGGLYDWTCRVEEELQELKAAFPDALSNDRNRLVMSLRCLRISLEVRVQPPRNKKDGRPSWTAVAGDQGSDQSGRTRGGTDGSGSPSPWYP